MRLFNIASGSSGNSTYIGTDRTHLLVDAGISRKRILEGLDEAEIGLKDISGILVTHEHIDHISSLGILARTREIPIYATRGTIDGIKRCTSLGKYNTDLFVEISAGSGFTIGDIDIVPLEISHDANEPVGFKFSDGISKAAVVTDLGKYDEKLISLLKDQDLLMIEANHDVRMLEVGPYPYPVKQRILGNRGHLSNENSGRFLSRLLHDNIKKILLAHVSRENNTRELARLAVESEIDSSGTGYHSGDFDILVARPDAVTGLCC